MLKLEKASRELSKVEGQVGEMLPQALGVTNMEELGIKSVNAQANLRGVFVVARVVMR